MAATGCLYRAASGSGAGRRRSLPKRPWAERLSRAASSPGAAFRAGPRAVELALCRPSKFTPPRPADRRPSAPARTAQETPTTRRGTVPPPARGPRLTMTTLAVPAAPISAPIHVSRAFCKGERPPRHRRGGGEYAVAADGVSSSQQPHAPPARPWDSGVRPAPPSPSSPPSWHSGRLRMGAGGGAFGQAGPTAAPRLGGLAPSKATTNGRQGLTPPSARARARPTPPKRPRRPARCA